MGAVAIGAGAALRALGEGLLELGVFARAEVAAVAPRIDLLTWEHAVGLHLVVLVLEVGFAVTVAGHAPDPCLLMLRPRHVVGGVDVADDAPAERRGLGPDVSGYAGESGEDAERGQQGQADRGALSDERRVLGSRCLVLGA
jgi:hypothetical protein